MCISHENHVYRYPNDQWKEYRVEYLHFLIEEIPQILTILAFAGLFTFLFGTLLAKLVIDAVVGVLLSTYLRHMGIKYFDAMCVKDGGCEPSGIDGYIFHSYSRSLLLPCLLSSTLLVFLLSLPYSH